MPATPPRPRVHRVRRMHALALTAALLLSAPPREAVGAGPLQQAAAAGPLVSVVKVVDGDTLHVLRDGRLEKLRLLSVDTEEKISGQGRGSPLKPETVFGHETMLWAQELFAGLAEGDEPARVRLLFPEGEERRDVYGRLLCHVVLPDGRDYNLLLVELGKSPYFNKYGNSLLRHDDFVRAQAAARERKLGIWNPATNRARTPGAPSAMRPYELLLPWWQERAAAVDGFRRRRAADPLHFVAADDPAALAAALEHGERVEVFGTIERFFEEDDGSLTARFHSGARDDAFRAVVGPHLRAGGLEALLRRSTEELRQNYLWVDGRVTRGERGFRIEADERRAWRLAD